MKGPKFLKYVIPILTVLKANGGAGNSSNVIDQVIEDLGITEEEMADTTSNGESRIRNQIQWARFYLFKGGLIDNSQRGIWRLTKEGLESKYTEGKSIIYLSLFRINLVNQKQQKMMVIPKLNLMTIQLKMKSIPQNY